jgi:CBS domain containing-hemolysin-like protein
MQALSTLVGLVFLGALVVLNRGVGEAFVGWIGAARYAVFAAVISCTFLTVVGSQGRKAWARWVGLAILCAQFASGSWLCYRCLILFGEAAGQVVAGQSPAEVEMLVVGIVNMSVALGMIRVYGFSNASRAWFRRRASTSASEAA